MRARSQSLRSFYEERNLCKWTPLNCWSAVLPNKEEFEKKRFKLFSYLQRCLKCSVAVHELLRILEAAWLQQYGTQDRFAYAGQPDV